MTVFAGILVTAFSAWIVTVIVFMARSLRSHPLLPDRWTRGFARWWARCWRWTRIFQTEHDVKVRIPKAHAPTLAELYPTERGRIVVKAKRIGGRGEAILTQEDIRSLNAKFIADGVAARGRR